MRLPVLSSLCFALISPAAFAHHGMDGATPNTFAQGLLSGLAHPLIGLDHFAFVLAVGFIAALAAPAYRQRLAGAFVAATLAGTIAHLQRWNLPAAEALIALSVLAAGGFVALHRAPAGWAAPLVLALAGVLHGYAYGESIVGAEPTPLAAYLLGFAAIQYALIVATAAGVARINSLLAQRCARIAGALIAVVGAYFSLQLL